MNCLQLDPWSNAIPPRHEQRSNTTWPACRPNCCRAGHAAVPARVVPGRGTVVPAASGHSPGPNRTGRHRDAGRIHRHPPLPGAQSSPVAATACCPDGIGRRARPSRTGVRQSSAAPGARPGCRRRGASGARRRAPGGGPGRTYCAPCQHRSPHLLPMADPDRQAPSAEAWMARLESRYAMAAQRHAHQVSSDTDGASPLRPDTEPDYF